LGFGVQSSVFGVECSVLGFLVWELGSGVWSWDVGFGIWGLGLRVYLLVQDRAPERLFGALHNLMRVQGLGFTGLPRS